MNFNDLFIGFGVAVILLALAWMMKPYFTNNLNRNYFLPALLLKMLSAVLLGMLYHFYYGGGDTFTYFTNGAIHIYEAFWDSPSLAFHLIFGDRDYSNGVFKYASQIWMYRDHSSYLVVRAAGFISLFVGGSYIGTSLIFAVLSFSGLWAMYVSFSKLFPKKEWLLAIAILFVPSAVFWGSGLLKDTITLGFMGWATASFIQVMHGNRNRLAWLLMLVLSIFAIYQIKLYLVMSLLPAMIVWTYFINIQKVLNPILRSMIAPFVIVITIALSIYAVYSVGQTNSKYSVENLAKTSQITAYDVGRWTGKNAGSRYDLGDLDGTYSNMISLAPSAINAALFRPYLWEVDNPLMLLAALEGLAIFVITITVIFRSRTYLFKVLRNPAIIFCLIFSLTFAFAVGISTYNFGTLFRYKVPMMPFYSIFLAIAWSNSSNLRQSNENLMRLDTIDKDKISL